MKNDIINHLFEFWEYIGVQGNFFHRGIGFDYTAPSFGSWPSKVFRVNPATVALDELYHKMFDDNVIPNSMGISADKEFETLLWEHNFQRTSSVKGMFRNISGEKSPDAVYPSICLVDSVKQSDEFAEIASSSFGYPVLPETIRALMLSKRVKLFIGKKEEHYAHCGLIYFDQKDHAGIHMIGTLPGYRGLGLGKIMTNRLLQEAHKAQSHFVYLIASEAGERIYSKIGVEANGALISYKAMH